MIKNNLISLFYFILCIIFGLLLSNLLLIVVLTLKGGDLQQLLVDSSSLLTTLSSHELLISQMCSQVFSLILPAYIYSKLNPESTSSLNKNEFNIEIFFLSLILFLSSIPLVAFSAYLNQLIPLTSWMTNTEEQMSALIDKMLNFNSVGDLLIAIIVIAIVPAIGEEWVFRGIIQNQIIRWTKNQWLGLVIAAIFFSAIHLQFQGFLPRFLLGMILGYIYLTTGNLWYSILLHFFNNGFQVLGVYFYREEMLKQLKNDIEMPNVYAVGFSIIAATITAYYLHKRIKINQHA